MAQQLTIEQILQRGLGRRAQRLSLDEMESLKVCSFDIEATGLKADIDRMICASIKPLHKKTITFRQEDFPIWETRKWDDSQLCKAVRDELEKYQVIVYHFGDLYDRPFVDTRLIGWDMRPIDKRNMVFVDTWRFCRNTLHMRNNRLITLIEYLNTKTQKSSVNGRMWGRATVGDKVGMDYVVKHNIADVIALEEALLICAKYFNMPYRMCK